MKAVIQRVKSATLSVGDKLISQIGVGLCVYFGVEAGDREEQADYMAKKIAAMRIFEDENGKMNKSLADVGGSILLISQFTRARIPRTATVPALPWRKSLSVQKHFTSTRRQSFVNME